jgi:hypothetical protein
MMVVLGVGQVKAQQAQPTPPVFVRPKATPKPEPQPHVNTVYDINMKRISTTHWTQTIAPNGDIHIDATQPFPGGAATDTATLTTTAVCRVTGNVAVFQCTPPETAPSGKTATPPGNLGPCDTWPVNIIFTTKFTNVPCPLKLANFPVRYVYYMPSCAGESLSYQEVGSWTVTKRDISGNCKMGYQASTNKVFISPDCQAGVQPCPPPPTPPPVP